MILGCDPLLAQFLAFESEHEAIFAASGGCSPDVGIQLEHLQINEARLTLRGGPEDRFKIFQHLLLALGIDSKIEMELNGSLCVRRLLRRLYAGNRHHSR